MNDDVIRPRVRDSDGYRVRVALGPTRTLCRLSGHLATCPIGPLDPMFISVLQQPIINMIFATNTETMLLI